MLKEGIQAIKYMMSIEQAVDMLLRILVAAFGKVGTPERGGRPVSLGARTFAQDWRVVDAMRDHIFDYAELLTPEQINTVARSFQTPLVVPSDILDRIGDGAFRWFIQARNTMLTMEAPLIGVGGVDVVPVERIDEEVASMFAHFLLSTPSDTFLEKLESAGAYIPFNICLWRPFITHEMAGMVVAKKGCGQIVVNQPNFALSEDIGRSVILGHYTMRSKAVVGRDRACMTIRNVMFRRYIGGDNATLFTSPNELKNYAPSYHGPSVIASLMPIANTRKRIRGSGGLRLPPDGAPPRALHIMGYDELTGTSDMFPGGDAFGRVWGLDQYIRGRNNDDDHQVNGLCFRGSSFHYNPHTGAFDKFVDATGHLGNAYVGCAAPRSGSGMFDPAHAQSGRGARAPVHMH